jgi:general secretion pathway protein K
VKQRNDRGIALVIALLTLVLLTVIVVEFSYEMQVEASLVQNQMDEVQAYLAAKSAIATGLAYLSADILDHQAAGPYDSFSDIWYAECHPNGPDQFSPGFYQASPDGNSEFLLDIEDEWGKIPLNALVPLDGSTEPNEFILNALRQLFSFVYDADGPADAIVDWMDLDDEDYGAGGAENQYYSALETPYSCKNGPMDNIEELLMVRGITPDIYFGDPTADPPIPPLHQLLTVHGSRRGEINANTADYWVLFAVEEAGGGTWTGLADEITSLRSTNGPVMQVQDFQQMQFWPKQNQNSQNQTRNANRNQSTNQNNLQDGQTPMIPEPPLTIASRAFHIQGDGASSNVKTRIDAYVWRHLEADQSVERFRILDWRVTR